MEKKRKIQMNKIYPFIVSIIAVVVMITIYVLQIKFEPLQIIEYSGYGVSGSKITENLLNKKYNNENNEKIEAIKIEEQAMLYKKLNKYYIGEEKKLNINTNYPIYINGNVAIYSLAEDSTLITTEFKEEQGYPNITITDGILYNASDLTRADSNEYILIKNSDKIFINTKQISVKTWLREKSIKMNSIMYFTEEYIAYYEMEDGYFIYHKITEIDNTTVLKIGEIEIDYGDFLENLNLKTHKKEAIKQEENKIEEEKADVEVSKTEEKDKINEDEKEPNKEPEEILWQKPEVSCTDFQTNVYTTNVNVQIKDVSATITKPVTFTFMKGEKISFKTSILSGGNITINGLLPNTQYTVIGTYQYKNEEGETKQVEFTKQTIKTNTIDSLAPIVLNFQNGERFFNKIQITNFKITSDLNSEAIKGIKKAQLEIDGKVYKISNNEIAKLLQGQEITYETPESIESNSRIQYEIKFYDAEGSEIKLENNKGETTTYKQRPTVIVSVSKQNIIDIELGINLNNKDNIIIENYRYEVFNELSEIVAQGILEKNQKKLKLTNLNDEEYFRIKVYGDFDQEDGKGKQENQELGDLSFVTAPISKLGYIHLKTEQTELTDNNIKMNLSIDTRTKEALIVITNKLKIDVYEQETDELIKTQEIFGDELGKIKGLDIYELNLELPKSYTKYRLEITGYATQGKKEHEIKATYTIHEFMTLKKEAEVQIKGVPFITGDMIDFDFRIEDKDGAVLNNVVRYVLKDSENKVIQIDTIQTNQDYKRQTYNKLKEGETYNLYFYAEQYNIGNDNSGYKTNYEFVESMEFTTNAGISGDVELVNLINKGTGKNLVDVESNVKWNSYTWSTNTYYSKEYNKEENTIRLCFGHEGMSQYYLYDLSDYIGQTVTISFQAKLDSGSCSEFRLYNGGYELNYDRNAIDYETTDTKYNYDDTNNYKRITAPNSGSYSYYEETFVVGKCGYVGVHLRTGSSSTVTYVSIKDFQIELGDKKTEYEPYNGNLTAETLINLKDEKSEIETKDYYVKIYKNNTLIQEERYEELLDSNEIKNELKQYMMQEGLEYKVELVVKIKNREYVLDSINFNTGDKEIKGIKNLSDFRKINPEGNYRLLTNIDLSGATDTYWTYGQSSILNGTNIKFNGSIDFNGYTLTRDAATVYPVFYQIGERGSFKNIVFDVKLNNSVEKANFRGLFYYNYGSIQNIKMNLIESTEVPNISIALIGNQNNGIIEKFIINMQESMYGERDLFGGVICNYGTMQDGYAYGENIEEIYDSTSTNKYAAGVLWRNYGTIKNVYSLININQANQQGVTLRAGNVLGVCDKGTAENLYSVGSGDTTNFNYGPTVSNIENRGKVNNTYYFSNSIFTNSYNKKTTILALHDNTFQNDMLNSNGAFNIEEMISLGKYPHLNMSDVMPAQEYIDLPQITKETRADILSMEIIEQGLEDALKDGQPIIDNQTGVPKQQDYVRVKFNMYNPEGVDITRIKVDELTCNVESQTNKEGKSEVIVKLNNAVRALSKYSVREIYSNQWSIASFEVNERPINVEFYKLIYSVEDWKNIRKSTTENYKLMTDLDFKNEGSTIYLNILYSGKLNGNGHKISNITFTGDGLISKLNGGKVCDLYIENCEQTNNSNQYACGIIGTTYQTSIMDNVHIKGYKIKTYFGRVNGSHIIGGLIGNIAGVDTTVKNCSVTDITIENNSSSWAVGGVVGYIGTGYTDIKNCFVQNLNVNTRTYGASFVGGIVGFASSNMVTIENCYATGKIYSSGEISGISGRSVNNITIRNCYSLVDLESKYSVVGGIYWPSSANTKNNLSIGNLYSADNTARRISNNSITTTNNYAYANQKIDGIIKKELLGAKELLTEEQLKDVSTYTEKLEWTSYNLEGIENGILPKLKKTDGEDFPEYFAGYTRRRRK